MGLQPRSEIMAAKKKFYKSEKNGKTKIIR
jgi:hypothetical protein